MLLTSTCSVQPGAIVELLEWLRKLDDRAIIFFSWSTSIRGVVIGSGKVVVGSRDVVFWLAPPC